MTKPIQLDAVDFWELYGRSLAAERKTAELQAQIQATQEARLTMLRRIAEKYGFDPSGPYTLNDADLTITTDTPPM